MGFGGCSHEICINLINLVNPENPVYYSFPASVKPSQSLDRISKICMIYRITILSVVLI